MPPGVDDTENAEVSGRNGELASGLWKMIKDDVEALFGPDVDFTVYEYADHLDVPAMPNEAVADVEETHDVQLVPYTACRMTVRKKK
jgi:hypothetical protein